MENNQNKGLPMWEEYTTEGKLTDSDIPLVMQQLDFWREIKTDEYVYMTEIASQLELNPDKQSTVEKIGQIVKYILCVYKIPIVSTSKGYYKASELDDLIDAEKSWMCRANASIKRMNAYYCIIHQVEKGPYKYFDTDIEPKDECTNAEIF